MTRFIIALPLAFLFGACDTPPRYSGTVTAVPVTAAHARRPSRGPFGVCRCRSRRVRKSSMEASSRTAAKLSRNCWSRFEATRHTRAAPMPRNSWRRSPTSRFTITWSTTTCVATGSRSWRPLTTPANSNAWTRMPRCGAKKGRIHARDGWASGAFSNASV